MITRTEYLQAAEEFRKNHEDQIEVYDAMLMNIDKFCPDDDGDAADFESYYDDADVYDGRDDAFTDDDIRSIAAEYDDEF